MSIRKARELPLKLIKAVKIFMGGLVVILLLLVLSISDCIVCEASSDKNLVCRRISIITCVDRYQDEKGKLLEVHEFSNLENGDIFITDSVHTMGIRHGHAAIVVDAANKMVLEAVTYGIPTKKRKIDRWSAYAKVVHLRITDEAAEEALKTFGIERNEMQSPSAQLGNIAARFAEENVGDIAYSVAYIGAKGKAPSVANLKKTQCAHLVWYVYAAFGVDIDATGGWLVTPRDIYMSESVGIVESFGGGVFGKSRKT